MAHMTGTTRCILDRMMRNVSSAVSTGISREGAIVPETTTIHKTRTAKHSVRDRETKLEKHEGFS